MLSRFLRSWLVTKAQAPMFIPRALLLLDFSLTILVFVQSAPGSGLFFAVNSGLPFLILLSFALEGMELFPDKFEAINKSPIVSSVRDMFFDDINTSQVLGLYLIVMQIKWELGVGDFGCYDNNVKYPNDSAKQEEYEALPQCSVTADFFLAITNFLFLALLTLSLIWRSKDVCALTWLITIITFVFNLRTNSNGLSPDSERRDEAVMLFQLGPICTCIVTVVFGVLPWLFSKCKEKRFRNCEDHFGTMLILQDAVLIVLTPAIWLLGYPAYRFNLFGFKKDKTILEAMLYPFSLTISFDRTKRLSEYKDKETVEGGGGAKVSDQNGDTEMGNVNVGGQQVQQQQVQQQQVQQVQLQQVQVTQVAQVPVQQQQQIMVICPPGMGPGSQLQIPTPAGPVVVVVPQGCVAGQQFPVIVNVPSTQMVMVTRPQGQVLGGQGSSVSGSGLLDFRNSVTR
ncbi:hypothetical protein TL16_g02308 [Triparma laevis f. inornata]|uniref:Uncharacterized protein n=1 Tax=Triparma laevis f. inornata TaxID=1714386 RepID=A0A9W6ZWI2_9STRA|nr:hypothetical protein TL16_g02308 [Triparma laevis f. inornata]